MNTSYQHIRRTGRGFTLIEIMLSIGILGIGVVMVLTVLPVGADWTRRSVDDSSAQTVALNAFAVLQTHYPLGSANASALVSAVPKTGQPLAGQLMLFPNINTNIPIDLTSGQPSERCYKWGYNT